MSVVGDAGRQFVAGGCAGMVEVCLMHPLDLVKTRFQVQRGPDDPQRYKSLADCFRRIYRSEGILSFYKGILPPILAETPKRATKFLTFEQYKKGFASVGLSGPALFALAGLGSGLTEALVICPFEVIKVRLQTETALAISQQKSTAQLAREIVAEGGLGGQGLYRGLVATLGRHGVWNAVYFGLYHSAKHRLPTGADGQPSVAYRLALGFTAGSLASVTNIPYDVAKSRIQGPQPDPASRKYHTCAQTIALVYKEEGFLALYKGLIPKIMRLGPGGGIMLVVYETVYSWLQ